MGLLIGDDAFWALGCQGTCKDDASNGDPGSQMETTHGTSAATYDVMWRHSEYFTKNKCYASHRRNSKNSDRTHRRF